MYQKEPRNYNTPYPKSNSISTPAIENEYYTSPNLAQNSLPTSQHNNENQVQNAYHAENGFASDNYMTGSINNSSKAANAYPCGGSPLCNQELTYATIYVPHQAYCPLYHPKDALMNGTVFPCLNQPYEGVFHHPCPSISPKGTQQYKGGVSKQ